MVLTNINFLENKYVTGFVHFVENVIYIPWLL